MKFESDESITCDACNEWIFPSDSYKQLVYKGKKYNCCNNNECMGKILLDVLGDLFTEKYLYTAEEKAFLYADMFGDD